MNQDEYISNIIKNGVIALVIGFIITGILYSIMYSVSGAELYIGFAILGAIYGFLFIKLDILENELDFIITNAVFAFFGTYVSINLIFSSALKVAMNSSFLTYQFALIAIIVAIVVNYIRDVYLGINPLESITLNLGKLPTMECPKCGVEMNAEDKFCPECGYEFICCPECGSKLEEDDLFCQECGHKLKKSKKNKKSKKTEDNSKKDKDSSKKAEDKSKNNEDKSKDEDDPKEDEGKVCSKCGAKLSDDAKFCQECGNKFED